MNGKLKPRSGDDLEFRCVIHRNREVLTWQSQIRKKHVCCIEVNKNAHMCNSNFLFIYYLTRLFLYSSVYKIGF